MDVEIEVERSMQSYLDCLDEESAEQPGFKSPPAKTVKKRRTASTTDPDCGYIDQGNKRCVGHLLEATVDCEHGILTGVDVYSADQRESLLVLRHLERQIEAGVPAELGGGSWLAAVTLPFIEDTVEWGHLGICP